MHQRKYFNSNFFINEIFSVEKFPNYGIILLTYKCTTLCGLIKGKMQGYKCDVSLKRGIQIRNLYPGG